MELENMTIDELEELSGRVDYAISDLKNKDRLILNQYIGKCYNDKADDDDDCVTYYCVVGINEDADIDKSLYVLGVNESVMGFGGADTEDLDDFNEIDKNDFLKAYADTVRMTKKQINKVIGRFVLND